MQGRHRGEVACGNGRLPGAEWKLPGQLRPERGFERQVFPRHRHAGVREETAGKPHAIVQDLKVLHRVRITYAIEGIA